MLNADLLLRIFPNCKNPDVWADALDPSLQKYSIDSADRIASFLAQTGYESGQFNQLEENLRYTTAARLVKVWPKRFPNAGVASAYINNPRKLADLVYAKRMGNGDAQSGDGYRYRGRGLIQLTGRSNYLSAAKAIGIDLSNDPDLLLQPQAASMSAAWFWQTRGLNELADDRTDDNDLSDFTEITRRINGGTTGVKDRFALFKKIYAQLH
jgi:putative chitinase